MFWLMVSEVSTCDTVGPRLAGQTCQSWWLGNRQRAKTVPGHTLCDPFSPARPHLPIMSLFYDPHQRTNPSIDQSPQYLFTSPKCPEPWGTESSCNKGCTHATQTCSNSSTVEKAYCVSCIIFIPPCLPCLPLSLTFLIPHPPSSPSSPLSVAFMCTPLSTLVE